MRLWFSDLALLGDGCVVYTGAKACLMKVLQVVSNPGIGGTETFVLDLVSRLCDRGVDARLANLWEGGGELAVLAKERNVPFIHFDGGTRRPRIRGVNQLRHYVRREGFDVVNGYGFRTSMILRLLMCCKRRPKLVIGLRGVDGWRRWYHTWVDRLTQGAVSYFVANSREVYEQRIEREATPPTKMLCIANGIDVAHFRPTEDMQLARKCLNIPAGNVFVTVANFRPQKGHAFQLDIIERILRRGLNATFVWVGAGALMEQLEKSVRMRGLEGVVRFVAACRDVRPVLWCADAFFLSSSEEGMPRALMEAIACGLPVVATRVGGTSVLVNHGVSGYLIDYGDVDAGETAIAAMIENPAARAAMGRCGRKLICDEFSAESMVDQFEAFYKMAAMRH